MAIDLGNKNDLPLGQKPSSTLRKAADLPLLVASGTAGAVGSLAESFGPNAVARGLKGVSQSIERMTTPESQMAAQRQGAIMDEAKGKGIGEQILAGGQAFAEAPGDVMARGIGSVVPFAAAQFIPGVGQSAAATRAVQLGMGVGMGLGSAKSSIYDEVQKRGIAAGKTPEQAKAEAEAAQAYGGPNTDQIALGGALGAADTLLGATPAAVRLARGLAGGKVAGEAAAGGLLKAGVKGALGEAPTEFAQGAQEQVAANIAAQRAGYDAGTWDGAVAKGTLEGLASAGPGVGLGMVEARSANINAQRTAQERAAAQAQAEALAAEKARVDAEALRAQKIQGAGPLTAAVNVMLETQAQKAEQKRPDFFTYPQPSIDAAAMRAQGAPLPSPSFGMAAPMLDSEAMAAKGVLPPADRSRYAPVLDLAGLAAAGVQHPAPAPLLDAGVISRMVDLGSVQPSDADLIAQEQAKNVSRTYAPKAGVQPAAPALGLAPMADGIPFTAEQKKPSISAPDLRLQEPDRPQLGAGVGGMLGGNQDPLASIVTNRRETTEGEQFDQMQEAQRRWDLARSGTMLSVEKKGSTIRPLSVKYGMELVHAKSNGVPLTPQQDGFLTMLRKEMGDDKFANMATVASQPFRFDKKAKDAIIKPNEAAIAKWDEENGKTAQAAQSSGPALDAIKGAVKPAAIGSKTPTQVVTQPPAAPKSASSAMAAPTSAPGFGLIKQKGTPSGTAFTAPTPKNATQTTQTQQAAAQQPQAQPAPAVAAALAAPVQKVVQQPVDTKPQPFKKANIAEWADRETAPVGTWVKTDYKIGDSQPVEQVRELSIADLYLPELDAKGELQPNKRSYLSGYTERLKAGEVAPSIKVVETSSGRMRVVDGTRRVMAAKDAGKTTIRALVSPLVDTPNGKQEATVDNINPAIASNSGQTPAKTGVSSTQPVTPTQPPIKAQAAPEAAQQPLKGASNGQGQETLLNAAQPTGAAAMVSGAPVADTSLNRDSSWIIREKATGKVVMETFDRAKVDALNTAKYEAVPIQQHLADQGAKKPSDTTKPGGAIEKIKKAAGNPTTTRKDAITKASDAAYEVLNSGGTADGAAPVTPVAKQVKKQKGSGANFSAVGTTYQWEPTRITQRQKTSKGEPAVDKAGKPVMEDVYPATINGTEVQLTGQAIDSYRKLAELDAAGVQHKPLNNGDAAPSKVTGIPAYSGNKASFVKSAGHRLMKWLKGAKGDVLYDAFGGGGGYGLWVVNNAAKNVNHLVINEIDQLRSEKLQWTLEYNGKLAELYNSPTLKPIIELMRGLEGGGSVVKAASENSRAGDTIAKPKKEYEKTNLPIFKKLAELGKKLTQEDKIAIQAVIDRAYASRAKDESIDTIITKAVEDSVQYHAQAVAFANRGGKISFTVHDGTDTTKIPRGAIVIADPPYLYTTGYKDSGDQELSYIEGPEFFEKSKQMLLEAERLGNTVIYHNSLAALAGMRSGEKFGARYASADTSGVAQYLDDFLPFKRVASASVPDDFVGVINGRFDEGAAGSRSGDAWVRSVGGRTARIGSTGGTGASQPGAQGKDGARDTQSDQRTTDAGIKASTGAGKADASNAALTSVVRNGGNSTAVLTDIAKNSKNHEFRLVAKAILAKGLPFDLRIRTDFTDGKVAHYSTDGHFVEFDPGMPFNLEQVLLHEAVHAVTSKYVASFGESTPLGKELAALFKLAEQHAKKTGAKFYGLTNADEFLAEVMTNSDFAQWLDTVPVPLQKSALSRFVRAVARFFGIQRMDGATPQTMDVFERIMLEQTRMQAEAGKKLSTSQDAATVAKEYGVDTEEDGGAVYFGDAEVMLNDEDNTYIVNSQNEFSLDHRASVAWAENNGYSNSFAASKLKTSMSPVEKALSDAYSKTGDIGMARDMAYYSLRDAGEVVKWSEIMEASKKMGRGTRASKGPGSASTSRHADLLRAWLRESTNRDFLRDGIMDRRGADKFDYELRSVPVSDVTPSQTGEDYLNASSEYTARQIASKTIDTIHRREDVMPIILDENLKIIDGNHRHAASTVNGAATIPALVRTGSGTGKISGVEAWLGADSGIKFSRSNQSIKYKKAMDSLYANEELPPIITVDGKTRPTTPDRSVPAIAQTTALNSALVRYGLGAEWKNAYEPVTLPDALSGIWKAFQAAFGRNIRAVAPTAPKFNVFNGVFLPSHPKTVFVNANATPGFIQIAGHELWHDIARSRPDLIKWYRSVAAPYYKNFPAYQAKLNSLLQQGEKPYSADKALEELEADVLGDSLADQKFLQALADSSPGKFRQLLLMVQAWLKKVAGKLTGLGSEQYVTDLDELRGYLKDVLVAFSDGKPVPPTPGGGLSFQRDSEVDYTNIRFSRADNGGALPALNSEESNWDAPIESKWDDYVFKLQDKNIDLKRVTQGIVKWSGQLADNINAYLQEELYHGRSAKRVQEFSRLEMEPALKALAAGGYQIEDIEEYMHARHAKEANAVMAQRNPTQEMIDAARAAAKADIKRLKDALTNSTDKAANKVLRADLAKAQAELKSWRGAVPFKGTEEERNSLSGMSNAAADSYFAKLPAADKKALGDVAAMFDAIMAGTNRLMVEYELESQDTIDGWGDMYQNYIPLHREDKDDTRQGTGQGFSIKGRETKGRTGSTRKVVNVLAHIAAARERTIVRGEKNRVSQALVGMVKAYPNEDVWKIGSPDYERVFNPSTGKVTLQMNPAYKSLPNVIVAKVLMDGEVKEVAVTLNEDNPRAVRMAAALKNLDAPHIEGWLGTVQKMTRYFASINTQYNPVFGVVNVIRDVQGAMINLGATPLADQKAAIARDSFRALLGIYQDIRATRRGEIASSQWSKLYEQFQHDGGQTGFRNLFETAEDRANDLLKIVEPDAWAKSGLGKFFTADGKLLKPASMLRGGFRVVFDWLSDYNEAMESGVRLAAYKAALDKGMTRDQAASLAKNLTVNFNRKGQAGTQIGAVYAFFNAAVQGTARIGETLMTMEPGKPKTMRLSKYGKTVVQGGLLLGSIQALALAAAGFGDDEPPDFVRERSLVLPTGWTGVGDAKGYVSVPMPLGLHVIPGVGRMITEFALSGGQDPAKRAVKLAGMFADAFNPVGNAGLSMQTIAPTVLDPLAALSENKDWTGKPIARVSFNKDAPGYNQHKDSATAVSKFLAELINTATGGNEYLAGVISPTPDQLDYLGGQVGGGVWRELSKVEQTVTNKFTGEETPVFKIPLLGRFIGSASDKASEGNAFYANGQKLNRLETQIKGLQKDGKIAEAAAMRAENPASRLIVPFNMSERMVQKLRKEKSDLIKAGADRERVKAIEDQITGIMLRMNESMKKLEAAS